MAVFVPNIYNTLIAEDGIMTQTSGNQTANNVDSRDAISSMVMSGITYQAFCYYDIDRYLCIAVRTLPSTTWTSYQTAVQMPVGGDPHNAASLGLDPWGFIHVCYGMHDTGLLYIVSDNPINTFDGAYTIFNTMLGTNESAVTYPTFFNDPAGNLYFMFRDWANGAGGDLFFYKYNHAISTWEAAAGTDTGGKLISGKADHNRPYWHRPAFDANFGSGGKMHLTWIWLDEADSDKYKNLAYVAWDGTDFHQSGGGAQTIPITTSNDEVIDSFTCANNVQPSNLSNCIYSDSDGHPHISFSRVGVTDFKLHHFWHNGSSWVDLALTTENQNYAHHSILFINRSNDIVYIIYNNDIGGSGLVVQKSAPGDFTVWTKYSIYPEVVGGYLAHYDIRRWIRDNIISMPICCYQSGYTNSPIYLFEPPFGISKTYVHGVRTEDEP